MRDIGCGLVPYVTADRPIMGLSTGRRLRAGMVASRLVPVEPVIPAQTDHLEDNGGVVGL
jgi:hypothetical protein